VPSAGLLATAGADNAIRLWALEKADDGSPTVVKVGEVRLSPFPPCLYYRIVTCLPAPRVVIVVVVQLVGGHGAADVNAVAWHPRDPGLLASAGDDCCVRLWRIRLL
jgi:WD40 repeat protein